MPEKLRRKYDEVKKTPKSTLWKRLSTIHAYSDLNQVTRQIGESFENSGDIVYELAKKAYPEKSFSDLQ